MFRFLEQHKASFSILTIPIAIFFIALIRCLISQYTGPKPNSTFPIKTPNHRQPPPPRAAASPLPMSHGTTPRAPHAPPFRLSKGPRSLLSRRCARSHENSGSHILQQAENQGLPKAHVQFQRHSFRKLRRVLEANQEHLGATSLKQPKNQIFSGFEGRRNGFDDGKD